MGKVERTRIHCTSGLLVGLLTGAAMGQCQRQWQLTQPEPAPNGRVFAVQEWDPDGPGPLGTQIVVGGDFTHAGGLLRNGIAAYDPRTGVWSGFGAGVPGIVRCLTTNAAGELIVGGSFATTAGAPSNQTMVWRNSAWAALGNLPVSGWVSSLARLPNGTVVAAGDIPGGVAQLLGSAFVPIGGGLSMSYPYNPSGSHLAVLANGDLVVSGVFDHAGNVSAAWLARWNGSTWSAIGGLSAPATALMAQSNGHLWIGSGVPAQPLLRWNGTSTSSVGGPLAPTGTIRAIAEMANGDLLVGGEFQSLGGVPATNLARWNGVQWSPVGSGVLGAAIPVEVLTRSANGSILLGGQFTQVSGQPATNLARTDGSGWLPVSAAITVGIRTMVATGPTTLVAAGTFHVAGNAQVNRIAAFDGQQWTSLGTGLGDEVRALAMAGNGELIAGGSFLTAGGQSAPAAARWDGVAWSTLGSGLDAPVDALLALPDGRVLAGGPFATAGGVPSPRLAYWTGSTWQAFPVAIPGAFAVKQLLRMPDGALLAIAVDGFGQNHLWRWNGTAWSQPAGTTTGTLRALSCLPNGQLVVGGDNLVLGGVAVGAVGLWNGTTWSSGFLSGVVHSLVALPNGDLVAVGDLPAPYHDLARRVGTLWYPILGGFPDPAAAGTTATCTVALPDGTIAVGGTFQQAGTARTNGFATLRTLCPTNLSQTPSACVGALPAPQATVVTPPWLGATYRVQAAGIAVGALPFAVIGTSLGNLPLAGLVPFAPPGCTLQPDPTASVLLTATAGVAEHTIAMPVLPAFLGVHLHHQFAQLELDPQGAPVGLTLSNTLSSVVGAL